MLMIVFIEKQLACDASGPCYRLIARHALVDAAGKMAFACLLTLI